MSIGKEAIYAPISDDHEEDGIAHIEYLHPQGQHKSNLLKIVFWIETANFLIILLLCALYLVTRKTSPYSDLPLAFNTTQTFTVDKTDLRYIKPGDFANSYWWNLTYKNNNGLVSLPITYADQHQLRISKLPAPKGETVFQVDAFHQLHCLDRLRNVVNGAKYLLKLNPDLDEEDPFVKHTLHCIDYLRQAVMCHADMTLVSTNRDLEFNGSPKRQCRDWNAVREWVMRKRYNFNKYLNGIEVDDIP